MLSSSVFTQLSSLTFPVSLQDADGNFRIYPVWDYMADKAYPAIVYQLDDYQPDYTMDGSDGMPTITLKIFAVGLTFDDADALGDAIANQLDGTKGTWGTTTVHGCFVEEMSQDHFVDTDMESILYYTKTLDCKVIYQA